MIDIPVYGRISVLKLFRPKNLEKDVLFVLTERYRFCVLEYVEGKEIMCVYKYIANVSHEAEI